MDRGRRDTVASVTRIRSSRQHKVLRQRRRAALHYPKARRLADAHAEQERAAAAAKAWLLAQIGRKRSAPVADLAKPAPEPFTPNVSPPSDRRQTARDPGTAQINAACADHVF
jgi:hypothetical protein